MAKNSPISSLLRSPGISRKLSIAFFAVIAVAALSLPVMLYSFNNAHDASVQANLSTATLRNVAIFQRSISEARLKAHELETSSDAGATKAELNEEMNKAYDAAACIAKPSMCGTLQTDRESLPAHEQLHTGIRLPDEERDRWLAIRAAATDAVSQFDASFGPGSKQSSVAAFNAEVDTSVSTPSQRLTSLVTARDVTAQDKITLEIANSSGLPIITTIASLLFGAILAVVIPRRLMHRLDHLRTVSHRLATGDFDARANEQYARRNDEIGDLISDFNTMAMAMQRNTVELRTAQEQLHIALQQEQERATRDPLTGLRNHRYFQDSLSAEIERCQRTGGMVSIAVLDLDDFKQVNDRFGHSEGDAVLRRATKGISDNLRPYDLACRLGGEEFGIIFPEATAEEAKAILDRIADHILAFGPNGERLSFSGGVTTWPVHAQTQAELYQRADEAAYTAKMQGKAATIVYDPATVSTMNSEERSRSRTRDAMLTTATTLVSAVDQKDPYMRHHSELVAIYAATIARAMRLDEATVKLVYRAGLLHDVGKIGIADEILVKGSQLTHDEWVQLRMHPEYSYRILEAAEMEPVATWTRHHHEHFDGTGYPFGLAGHDIPIGSRIVLVADAFESMTSDRIYRRSLGQARAVEELRAGAGAQFDPLVVDTMVQLAEQGVFTQVMQQYGRTIEPTPVDDTPAATIPAATVDAGSSEAQQPRSEAEAWAMDQLNAYQQQLDEQQQQQQHSRHGTVEGGPHHPDAGDAAA